MNILVVKECLLLFPLSSSDKSTIDFIVPNILHYFRFFDRLFDLRGLLLSNCGSHVRLLSLVLLDVESLELGPSKNSICN